jgi:hypothetical protein
MLIVAAVKKHCLAFVYCDVGGTDSAAQIMDASNAPYKDHAI